MGRTNVARVQRHVPVVAAALRWLAQDMLPTSSPADTHHSGPSLSRVLVTGDDRRVRAAVARLLAVATGVEADTSSGDADSILDAAGKARPDVVVVDLVPAELDAILVAVRSLRDRAIPVVTLSADTSVRASALAAGANAFVHKDGAPEAVVSAVRLAFASHLMADTDSPRIASGSE